MANVLERMLLYVSLQLVSEHMHGFSCTPDRRTERKEGIA